MRLLDFQVHALAVGVWTGGTFSGAELDSILPVPADTTPMPTTSDVLAAYVAAADSPGGALSRALMAGQDLLSPTTLQFPAVVLVLFASDISTDGGSRALSPGRVARSAETQLPLAALAMAGPGRAPAPIVHVVSGGVCSDTANWVNGTISSLFTMLKLATPDNLPGRIVVSIWNWLVSAGESFVQGLLSTVTDAVLGTIRSIAGTIATVATQIASLLPFGLRAVAVGPNGGGTFTLGSDPLSGSFNVSVSAGDLPDWPAVLADCAKVAKVPLADFHNTKDVPIMWGPLRAPADPLLSPTVPKTDDVTDANGQAAWGFTTSTDPGDPSGEQQNQVDQMPVTIHRPEVDSARAHLTAALLGFVPGVLQPFVAAIFAPYIGGLQARLNALLDARGTATAILVYHSGASPKPSVSASPAPPSGACQPNPVAPGTYTGKMTSTSSEIIDQGSSGKTVATSDGSDPVSVVVAADGSLSGTWNLKTHFVFDETVITDGVVGLHDHRDSTSSYTGGAVTGTACNLELGIGTYSVQTCMDSLKGDCTGDPAPPNRTPVPGGFGRPSSASAGHVVWHLHYASSEGAVVVGDLTIDVTGPTP